MGIFQNKLPDVSTKTFFCLSKQRIDAFSHKNFNAGKGEKAYLAFSNVVVCFSS